MKLLELGVLGNGAWKPPTTFVLLRRGYVGKVIGFSLRIVKVYIEIYWRSDI